MKIWNLPLCVIASIMMCLLSIISIPIPFTPIPATLQSIGCLIAGAALGGPYGALAMIIYVLAGVFGLPVYAGMNSGVEHLFSATGGYIIGFIPYAFITGTLVRRSYRHNTQRFLQFAVIFISMAVSTIIFYFFGVSYFSLTAGVGFISAVALAALPFIWIDLIKILFSAFVVALLFQIAVLNDQTYH